MQKLKANEETGCVTFETNVAPEVVEELLKVADAVEAHRYGLVDDEFLADQAKMLRRAISFFSGGAETLPRDVMARLGIERHPHVASQEAKDREDRRRRCLEEQ